MKKVLILSAVFMVLTISVHGQWYTKQYEVSDIDYLTQQQLEESVRNARSATYASLGVMGCGGLIILLEHYFPYDMEDDDNVTLLEQLLGEKTIHDLTFASGVVVAAGGAVASIVFLSRLGTIKSALNRNFPAQGSLTISPALVARRGTYSLCPGFTLTIKF